MSKALRDTKCFSRSTRCAGQISPPVQRLTASTLPVIGLISRTAWLPQAGQTSGKTNRFAPLGRFSSTDPRICGMTSPARCTITVSPMRTSLRAISSSLCSVAFCTTTPPTVTGSSLATGVSAPVRPTWISMSRRMVVAFSAGNLWAMRPARRARDEAQALLQVEAGRSCRRRRRCRSRGRRGALRSADRFPASPRCRR